MTVIIIVLSCGPKAADSRTN